MIAPLRRVTSIAVSEESGEALNPHYFWLTWEYTLRLDCGHTQVRARCAYSQDPAPEKLTPPLPECVRCADCPPKTSRNYRHQKVTPAPVFDPVMGALVAAMCKAAPDLQYTLIEWAANHGRYVPDEVQRCRAYGAVALLVIDTYLPGTQNPRAAEVRDAVQRWSDAPTADNRALARRATLRLYKSQRRDGDWYAHRGIIAAAKLTSPPPHNVHGVLECPTFDNVTRSVFYSGLWGLRHEHDEAAGLAKAARALTAVSDAAEVHADYHSERAAAMAAELNRAIQAGEPTLGEQHMDLAQAMLAAYQDAIERGERP